jgi:hypothetical protein
VIQLDEVRNDVSTQGKFRKYSSALSVKRGKEQEEHHRKVSFVFMLTAHTEVLRTSCLRDEAQF